MVVHESDGFRNGCLGNDSVGIEQQHIVALRLANSNVVGAGKAQVVIAGYDVDFRKLLAQIGNGVVVGMIVYNIHLGL